MPAVDPVSFFKIKHPWSEYKDQILDYYLRPYLPKVARLRKPILVVDCFAGAGQFEDGKPGSPLIIAKHVAEIRDRGIPARAIFIEKEPTLAARLSAAVAPHSSFAETRPGDFHDHIDEFAKLARSTTLFLYLDPINPNDLLFDDLADVYRALGGGGSVEILVNFLSTAFYRQAAGFLGRRQKGSTVTAAEKDDIDWIFGGSEWESIIGGDGDMEAAEPIDKLARVYSSRLRQWFNWNLHYAIKERYEDRQPKYHLVFGSRSSDAVHLMNQAMVTARRKFLGAMVKDTLFPTWKPDAEVVDPASVEKLVLGTLRLHDGQSVTWEHLRAMATCACPALYMEKEFNAAIKSCLKRGAIVSPDADGRAIREDAVLRLVPSSTAGS